MTQEVISHLVIVEAIQIASNHSSITLESHPDAEGLMEALVMYLPRETVEQIRPGDVFELFLFSTTKPKIETV